MARARPVQSWALRKKKALDAGTAAMDTTTAGGGADEKSEGNDAAKKDGEKAEEKKDEEPAYTLVVNPCRIVPSQEAHVRFLPLSGGGGGGDAAMADAGAAAGSLAEAEAKVRYTPVRTRTPFHVTEDSRPRWYTLARRAPSMSDAGLSPTI